MPTNSNLLSSPTGSPAREEDVKALRFIEEMTQNADAVQKKVLAEILSQNAHTEYLKGLINGAAADLEIFKSKVPMTTYEDIVPFIRRIADGDCSPILSAQPISEFISSSGTSNGEPKLIPSIKEEAHRRLLLCTLLPPIMNLHVKGLDKGKALMFLFTRSDIKTKGGIVTRTSLTSLYKSDLFKVRLYDSSNVYTSPIEAIYCVDTFQSMYIQMLCGLYEREQILRVGAMFASGLLRVITFLKLNWQQLAHDIRTGSLHTKVTDPSLRGCMTPVMRADPNLADLIVKECERDIWEGIIVGIWPNTKYLDVIVSGTMSQYIPTLDYYSGGLPKASTIYASSECYFGLNLDPMCQPSEISYTLMPNMAYFEFLPHEPDSNELTRDHSGLVDLVNVEIGKQYEVVVTTFSGLYRYQVGDILQVTGFHNRAPQFRFVQRKNVLLSIDSDKTDEVALQAAVGNASQLLLKESNTRVCEYTSYADTTTVPGHYVIYWELLQAKGNLDSMPSDNVLEQCCLVMEESLDSIYRLIRVSGNSIGPLEIRVVKIGTFEKLMDYAISRGASINQYKVPRCVSLKPMVDLLDSRVASTHFSPSLPKWTPELCI